MDYSVCWTVIKQHWWYSNATHITLTWDFFSKLWYPTGKLKWLFSLCHSNCTISEGKWTPVNSCVAIVPSPMPVVKHINDNLFIVAFAYLSYEVMLLRPLKVTAPEQIYGFVRNCFLFTILIYFSLFRFWKLWCNLRDLMQSQICCKKINSCICRCLSCPCGRISSHNNVQFLHFLKVWAFFFSKGSKGQMDSSFTYFLCFSMF